MFHVSHLVNYWNKYCFFISSIGPKTGAEKNKSKTFTELVEFIEAQEEDPPPDLLKLSIYPLHKQPPAWRWRPTYIILT